MLIQQQRTSDMSKVNIAYNEELLLKGYRQHVTWDMSKAPHMAIQGATGQGKTYLLKLLLARISTNIPNSHITVCDYKGDNDFSFLMELDSFFRFDNCMNGLNTFYEKFLTTQKCGQTDAMRLLVFDEWASFLNSLEKKEAADAKKKLASLMMLGRSFDYHVILSQQRLDAEYFDKARDNINVLITLGNPSKEVKEMFYHDYKDQISNDRMRGTGYMLTNGTNLQKIVVPQITSMDKVNQAILKNVSQE